MRRFDLPPDSSGSVTDELTDTPPSGHGYLHNFRRSVAGACFCGGLQDRPLGVGEYISVAAVTAATGSALYGRSHGNACMDRTHGGRMAGHG